MLLKKLPEVYQQNNLMAQMVKLVEDKKVLFSSSVYCDGGKTYVIKKTSGKPIFDIDRPIYSMVRGMSKTLITSDSNLKSEKDTFKTHFSRGDKDIQKMYDTLRENQKQNVFVMTEQKKEDISTYINTDLYNLVGPQVLKKHETDITLKEIVDDLWEKKMAPILIECGPTCINEYLQKAKNQKDKNIIELVYFACFEGKMKKECIGDEYKFDETLFKKVWESDKFDVKDDMQNTGKLWFKVYERKD